MKFIFTFVTVLLMAHSSVAGPLHEAVRSGDAEEVDRLLASGEDPSEVDFLAGSPLHIAALKGHTDLIDRLAEAGADPHAIEFGNGSTPLHWAALTGQTQAVERLLNQGAEIDSRNDAGDTPLLVSLENGHTETGAALIDAGADIAAETNLGLNPIQLAAQAEDWDLVDQIAALGGLPPDPEPVSHHLATADLDRAKELWASACGRCHGPVTRTEHLENIGKGPPLGGVIGRDIASVDGYPYSAALRRAPGVWTYEKLSRYLTNPGAYWPGTTMTDTMPGRELNLPDVTDRAAVIQYMRLNANPVPPLP